MALSQKLVSDLRDQDRVRGVYRVVRKALPLGRSGKHFLALTLGDRSGEIEARAFDEAERWEPRCATNGYVKLEAVAELYKGRLELKLLSLDTAAPDEIDPELFVPRTRFDPPAMRAELRGYVEQVRSPFVRELLLSFLDDPELGPALERAPAAKSVHHAFVGGLLEHTLSIVQLGWRVCDHYPQLDRDLVTAGCILHDLGKTLELRPDGPFEYTDVGKLVGHLVLTCQWIHERAARIEGFPRQLEWHLTHLVVAHHGKLEHGSPKEPQTLEAMVVHALDELDSRVSSFGLLFARDRSQGSWTEWQRLYDRPLFKGPSWDGKPLPHDPRRFQGPGLYEADRPSEPPPEPAVIEIPEEPVALPGPGPAPASQGKARPLAVWERPEPRLRPYAMQAPHREYARASPEGPQLPSQGPRPPEPQLPERAAPEHARKEPQPADATLDLFKERGS